MMNITRLRFPMTSAAILLMVIGAGTLFAAKHHKHPTSKSTQVAQTPINVMVSKATNIVVPDVLTSVGHMKAIRSVMLSFDVDGHIVSILAKNGQSVRKGQIIAKLNDKADQAQLISLTADYKLKQSTYKRMEEVNKVGGISQQTLDKAKNDMVAAQSQVQQQQVLINEKQLKAPFAGVLGSFEYNIGAYLPKGTALVQLVQQAPIRARYSIPASYRSQMEIGQAVSITTTAYPKKAFNGVLSYISPNVDKTTGTVVVEASFPNKDFLLLPGMFVSVTQTLNPNRKLLMISDIALMTDINGQYIYKVVGDHVEKVHVKVGVISKNMAQITSGLKLGDEVVTAGQQRLVDGSRINIIKTQLPGAGIATSSSKKPIHKKTAIGS